MASRTRKLVNPILILITLAAIGVLGYQFHHFSEDRLYVVYPISKYYRTGFFGDSCGITTRLDYDNTQSPEVRIRVPCIEYPKIAMGQEWPVISTPRFTTADTAWSIGASLVLIIIAYIRLTFPSGRKSKRELL